MQLSANEITRIIKDNIKDFEQKLEIEEIGYVLSAGDGIARILWFK